MLDANYGISCTNVAISPLLSFFALSPAVLFPAYVFVLERFRMMYGVR
jgi:hypothetical protein